MAIVENQMVEVKWTNIQAKYYMEKGYEPKSPGETFYVNVLDLTPNSNKEVKVLCDCCGEQYLRKMINMSMSKDHYCSSKCQGKIAKISGSRKAYTEEELKQYFNKYHTEFGVYPRLRDFDKIKGFPGSAVYLGYWETYSDFLKEINIITQDNTDGWYIHDEEILRNHYENGSKDYILDHLMVKRNWNTVKRKASKLGLKRKVSKSQFTKEELINKLIQFTEENKRPPKISDCKNNSLPSEKVFRNHFGSWNNALKQSGLVLNTDFATSKEEIQNRALKFYQEHGRSPYRHEILKSKTPIFKYWISFDEFLESMGLPLNKKKRTLKFKTDEELIRDYKGLYESLGRIPIANDIDNCEELASFTTYINRFNTYENIWELCGIEESINILKKTRYGSICLDKNGGLCKSFAEMVITNLLIDNNIAFIKEFNYKNIFPDYSGKTLVMDWYLPDYDIAVEYFGLYRERQNDGVTSSYKNKTKKKIELFKTHNVPLIELYQEDLNEVYLSRVVNKFKIHSIKLNVLEKNLYKNRKV